MAILGGWKNNDQWAIQRAHFINFKGHGGSGNPQNSGCLAFDLPVVGHGNEQTTVAGNTRPVEHLNLSFACKLNFWDVF